MTLGVLLIYIVLGLSGLGLIMFPEARRQLKILTGGFINIFIEDKAKTPEGAKAIFSVKIAEAQEKYNTADNILRRLSGRLKIEQDNLIKVNEEIVNIESKCESLVRNNKFEEAQILSDTRDELLANMKRITKLVSTIEPNVEQAKMLHSETQKRLKDLKLASKQVVEDLKMNKELAEMFDDMDALKNTTPTDRLLAFVNDGLEESNQQAIGAKVVHENKLETKTSKALLEANKINSSDYIAQLKQKCNKDEQ